MNKRSRWVPWLTVLALCAGMAVGCGSDRGDDRASGDTTPATSSTASESKKFGTLESPCGPGESKGATDVGVSDDAITIGYGDDNGYQGSPGMNHEIGDAVKAMISWCNDQGGINGRAVKGNYYDAKLTEVNNVLTSACTEDVFMLVGQGYALDSMQEAIRLGCDLPAFPSFAVSPEFANAPLMYSALPNPVDYMPIPEANWYAKTFPDKAKKLAFVYANYAATQDTAQKAKSTWPQVGMVDLECDQVYNIVGEADWKPFVQKLKSCGAEVATFIGSPYPNFENLLEAAAQLDFEPDWILQPNFYDHRFAKWNTNGFGDNVYVWLASVPLEHAGKNKATKDYMDIVEAGGGDVSDLGMRAASAFLLWAQSVKACGNDVTRACVLMKASAVHDWTGGGMSGAADVGENMPTKCTVVLNLKGTEWRQVNPDVPGELDCDDDNVKLASGPVVDKVGMGDDRIVHKYESRSPAPG